MADNLAILNSAGVSKEIATKDISGVHYNKHIIVDVSGNPLTVESNRLNVNTEKWEKSLDLYLYDLQASPDLTTSTVVDTDYIDISSVTGVSVGDVITIYEGNHIFQSLITGISTLRLTLASLLDRVFTTGAIVEVGHWNMAVDGSGSIKTYKIKPPAGADMDIHTINVSITDNSIMDSSMFGGLSSLVKGILFRTQNSEKYNRELVVSNIGFDEQGFDIGYDSKAPSGVYGFRATKILKEKNGATIKLLGASAEEYQMIVQDNLSSLSHMSVSINGHILS